MRIIVLLLPLLFAACQPKSTAGLNEKAMANLPIPSAWQLVSCEIDGKTIPAVNDKAFIAIRDGEIGGHTGCNAFGGEWTGSPGKMKVPGVMSTKMFCNEVADQERLILELLNGTVSATTRDGKTLEISAGNQKLTLTRNDKHLK